MPELWMDVDAALSEVPVNIFPLLDATDFKTIENALAYNASAMALFWHFVTTAGAYSVTAVTPTTGGNYDWTDQGDSGIYTIEIPASGGASINNDTEGFGWFTGSATGVLPWRGPTIGFRRAALNDMFIDGSTASTNLEDFFDGTGYAGGTTKLGVDVVAISGDATAANNEESFFDGTGYAGTNNVIPTVTTVNGLANGVITAASIATGAIDADAIAADAVTEIQSGLATAAALATVYGIVDKLDTAMEADGAVYRFTVNALELAPTGGSAPTVEQIRTEMDTNSTKLAAIEADTQDLQTQIGTDGAGLTNIPWNAAWDAEVQSECADAIAAAEPIDANITKINNTTVTGDGDATPWGPA